MKAENDYGISDPGEESDPFDVGAAGDNNRCASELELVVIPKNQCVICFNLLLLSSEPN